MKILAEFGAWGSPAKVIFASITQPLAKGRYRTRNAKRIQGLSSTKNMKV